MHFNSVSVWENRFLNAIQKEAKSYFLSRLEEKYGEKFIVVGNEQYEDGGPIFGYAYGCFSAPENEPDKTAGGRVTQRGNINVIGIMHQFGDYKMKKRVLIAIGILTLSLGGCRMNHKYTNQEEAKSYLLTIMDKKYDETFAIVGNEDYENYGLIYGDCYSCDLAPKDEPDKVGNARITQDGNLIDNWAVNYFKDEAEKEVNTALSGYSNDNMTIKSISLQAPSTSDTWRAEDGIAKYLKESGAYMKIIATSNRGLSNDEYAELIYEFLKPMYSIKMNMEVSVKVGRTYIFFETINTLGENKTPEFTLEQIKQEVIEEWDSSPFETH